MQKSRILIFLIVTLFRMVCNAQEIKTNYINSFENANHPQVAYWFFAANMMPEASFKGKIDSFVKYSKYTLIYLPQQGGCDFYDAKTLYPIFNKLVPF